MAYGGRKNGSGRDGDAAHCGYSRLSGRPRTAAPGYGFVSDSEAKDYDEISDLMSEFGGRESALWRRFRDEEDDSYR